MTESPQATGAALSSSVQAKASSRCPFVSPAAEAALLAWWRSLDEHRGERAVLRRARELKDIQNQNLRRLRYHLKETDADDLKHERLAAVAGLLAHVREHDKDRMSFAVQMAEGDGRPTISQDRFRRLLQREERADLYHPLLRVLHTFGTHPRTNVCVLAHDVCYWGDRVREAWARDYYGFLLKEQVLVLPDGEQRADRFGEAAEQWWEDLCSDSRRGERAELKRCRTLHEVRLTPAYHRLRFHIPSRFDPEEKRTGAAHREARQRVALVAGLLAYVEKKSDKEFARQMAAPLSESGSRAAVHGLRFRRLLQHHAVDDDLFRLLRRVVMLTKKRANAPDLAESVLYWGDRRRGAWARDYYTHPVAKKNEP